MLKIRAWMDNIVRKKKSKSKHSSAIMGKDCGFSSPTLIRRSEISPLQNTNGGRAGWKTPDSPVHMKMKKESRPHVEFTMVDQHGPITDAHLKKKVTIASQQRHHPKRSLVAEKHCSHSSGNSDFGSVMNYVSSPESAYSTGYSTLHSDDCLSPAGNVHNKPEYYVNIRSGVQYTPSFEYQIEAHVPKINCPLTPTISYVDSPSPRQRSRIRTNPWLKSQMQQQQGSGAPQNNSLLPNEQPKLSLSNCSSPSRPYFKESDIQLKSKFAVSPNSLRKRKHGQDADQYKVSVDSLNEDDSTLKEIMGKFDESYTYDKETDILSDSDHTQCQDHSDYEDTGQDAEDEYEEEAEIDYIDKHAVSISDSVKYKNSGSCEYYVEKKQVSRASLKLRKRLRRTRKKSECSSTAGSEVSQRECRSVGGTPLLNRRSIKTQAAVTERCNSLNTLNSPQKTLITIAESEKQLLKSDLEAFLKYRELITEAETLLGSFKYPSSAAIEPSALQQQQPPHGTRNVPHLPNKRVEMLRAEESKRSDVLTNHHTSANNNLRSVGCPKPHISIKPHSPLPVNKKIQLLKQEQYAFGPPVPPPRAKHVQAKENHPPLAPQLSMVCPSSEPLKRKVYVPASYNDLSGREMYMRGSRKQEMILKTLEDLKRSLEDQKTQLYSLNEKP